jgi:mRNA interferase HigB
MHVIARKPLREFWERHPESEGPLARWFKIVEQTEFQNFEALPSTFPTADQVGDLIVFNIGGNRYRLVAAIHFNRRKVDVRRVLTHEEYDRGDWRA